MYQNGQDENVAFFWHQICYGARLGDSEPLAIARDTKKTDPKAIFSLWIPRRKSPIFKLPVLIRFQVAADSQSGVLDVLLAFLASRPANALPPNLSDLWFLYHTVTQRKPRIILEFGSGCSTAIMAQALWDNHRDASHGKTSLYSVDADAYWATATARAMPVHLRNMCHITSSPLLKVEYAGVRGFRHASIPDVAANLVYLDGPALTSDRAVAIDVLDMEDRLPDDFYMVIDGRKKNTLFLQQHMKRQYRFKARRMFRNQIFELIA
jgi:hypothetical protein